MMSSIKYFVAHIYIFLSLSGLKLNNLKTGLAFINKAS